MGIPHHFRAIVWQLLCNAQNMPIKDQYSELLKMTSPCEKLIRRDIARTYPEHEFFKEKDSLGQEVLFNVMKVRCLLGFSASAADAVIGRFCADADVHPTSSSRHLRPTLWWTARWATVKGAPSSWDCCSCR